MKRALTFKQIEFRNKVRKTLERKEKEEAREKDLADKIMELVKAGFTKAEILEVINKLENPT